MSFYSEYFFRLTQIIEHIDEKLFTQTIEYIDRTKQIGGKIILAGNGGSAAIASHVSVDFIKAAGHRAINFNESDLITCFANDYGYENWVLRAIEFYADPYDLVILISSSGKSQNIINAANYARETGIKLITFSGFDSDNPLRQIGNVNFWVDSKSYNYVEITHQTWLLAIVDYLIERAK